MTETFSIMDQLILEGSLCRRSFLLLRLSYMIMHPRRKPEMNGTNKTDIHEIFYLDNILNKQIFKFRILLILYQF